MHVVSGVAIRNGRILMGKRMQTRLRPGMWELPGGKVENGEHPELALAREWREEMGVIVQCLPVIISTFSIVIEMELRIDLYEVTELVETPQPLDHDQLEWVSPLYAVERLPCTPGYYLHYNDLRKYMLKTNRWAP